MGKVSFTGVVLTVLGIIFLAAVIASQIQVGGQAVNLPGIADRTEPVSLLQAFWTEFVSLLGDLLPWN